MKGRLPYGCNWHISVRRGIRFRIGLVLGHRGFPFLAALIAMAVALPSLRTGFQSDDLWHRAALSRPPGLDMAFDRDRSLYRVADGNPARTRQFMDIGLLPWWCAEDFKLKFWRPGSELTHRLDYALWPEAPAPMHLQSILWYGGWILCASFLYRRVIPKAWVAGLAGLLFAMDYTHSLPACWLAARSTVVSALFGTGCLLLHDAWRRGASRYVGLLAAMSLGLALLSKEAAIGVCAYLLAYVGFVETGRIRSRLWSLAPYALVVAVWHVAYRLGGFGACGSDVYFDPADDVLGFLQVICSRAPVLLLGQWGLPPAEMLWILSPSGRQVLWLVAVVLMAALFYVLVPLLRAERAARFCFAGMLMATAPACLGMASSRQLEYVGFGAVGLLALLMRFLFEQARSGRSAWDRWTARVVLPVLVVIHLVLCPINFVMTHRCFVKTLATQEATLTQAAMMGPALAGRTVVLLNPPCTSYTTYLLIDRALAGRALPAHVWALAPGRFTRQTVQVRRLDARVLQMHVEGGVPIELQRGSRNPLPIGKPIVLDGMTVTVSAVGREGWPTTMIFAFAVPLESAAIAWFRAQGTQLVPWTPPAVGDPAVILP